MSTDRTWEMIRRLRPEVPPGVPSRLLDAAALGGSLVAASIGVPWILSAMILWGRKARDPAVEARLTRPARLFFEPERDMGLFVLGCAATVLLAIGLDRAWRTRLRRLGPGEAVPFLRALAASSWGLAIVAAASFLAALKLARPPVAEVGAIPLRSWLLFLPGAIVLLAALIGYRRLSSPAPLARLLEKWDGDRRDLAEDRMGGVARRRRDASWTLATAALLVAILAVPSYRELAGKVMALDFYPFHHWDFFAIGPAVSYSRGRALGTEAYSQYGVGWPVLLAWVAPIVPLGYGNAIHLGNIYVCLYFFGTYLLLRRLLGDATWAASGAVMSAYLTMYYSSLPGVGVWMHPNSTILRSPTDVWFFLAMLAHLRSGRLAWGALMGAFAGLGVVFTTDTGIDLAAVLLVEQACVGSPARRPDGSRVAMPRRLAGLLLPPASAALAMLAGLAVASRGTILRGAFWAGWLEAITDYGGGIGALPMATLTDRPTLVLFLVMAGTYLAASGILALAFLEGRADRARIFAGCLAAYGLARMLYFVNRSHPFNLPHVSIPFCLLATWSACLACRRLEAASPRPDLVRDWGPRAALALALALLAASPSLRAFPSLLRELVAGPPERGLCPLPDVCGLPPSWRPFVDEFEEVTRRLAALRAAGASVAVLDMADTMYYLASGCTPPGRYCPLLPAILRKDQLERIKARMTDEEVEFLFVNFTFDASGDEGTRLGDVLAVFREWLKRNYAPAERIGRFTVWRRVGSRRTPGASRVHS